jgi:cleavage and polyadenylation specificity factor subunit 3
MIKFLPVGGADDIGASCFYLYLSGSGILLDCGIHPQKEGTDALPKFDELLNLPLDYVFISHAHQDHIGSLPFLVQKYSHVIIYTTPQTKDIANITLHNAANILSINQAADSNLKIYNHEEIDLLVRSIRTIEYENTIELTGMRHNSQCAIKITFYDAGHILGSASVLIEHEGHKILYTGDINIGNQSIMEGADLKKIASVDTLILESTYAGTDSKKIGTWESESKKLAKSANQILHKGGSILIPVFALGKAQEVLAMLIQLMEKGLLTQSNIFTGGISREISKLYDQNRYIVNRQKKNLELNTYPQLNHLDINDYNFFQKNPGIVLASSGMMLPSTTSYKLLDYWFRQDNFAIFCVGYMDPETPGFKVVSSHRGDAIQLTNLSPVYKIGCGIEKFYFPSHSRREDLLSIVKRTSPKEVILVHGDNSAKDWLGYNTLTNFKNIRVFSARVNNQIIIGSELF